VDFFSILLARPCSLEQSHGRIILVATKRDTYERSRLPSSRILSEDSRSVATAPHRSDRNWDGVGRAAGPGERVADTVGMFELYRRRPHPLFGDLRRVATRPDRDTPRKVASSTRGRQSLKRSARSSGIHECRSATSTGTTTRRRASGPSPLRLSPCGTRPLLGSPLDLWAAILLPPVRLRPTLLWTTPPWPPLVTRSYPALFMNTSAAITDPLPCG
jgi:hypothetical protein